MDQDRQNLNELADNSAAEKPAAGSAQELVEERAEEIAEERAQETPVQEEQALPTGQEFYYTPVEESPQEPEPVQEPEKKGRDHIALILGCVAIGCYLLDSWFGCCCMGGMPALAAVVLSIVSLVLALRYKKQTGSLSDKGVAAVIISAIVLGLCVVSAISSFFSGIFGVLGGIFDALMEEGVEEDFSVRFDFAIKMLTLF